MAQPKPKSVPRSRRRALLLSGWLLGTAALVWGGTRLWQAQPAVRVAPQASKVAAATESVEEVAMRALRGRFRDPAATSFQDVRAYRFGPADERAVCGRVASRDATGGAAEFVVRVILPGSGRTGGSPLPVVEEGPTLPRATANARRRYCRDADEPRTPPAPAVADALAAPGFGAGGNAQSAPSQGGGAVTVLRRVAVGAGAAANLRNGPGGGAAVIAVLPRGQVLDVFERAPGGWVRVGMGEPWGWTHASLLSEAP